MVFHSKSATDVSLPHYAGEIFENSTIVLDFCLTEESSGSVFLKFSCQNVSVQGLERKASVFQFLLFEVRLRGKVSVFATD